MKLHSTFKKKLAADKMTKLLRKAWQNLGPTHQARVEVAAKGGYAPDSPTGKLMKLFGNSFDKRRGVARLGEGEYSNAAIGFHPDHGFVANKAFKHTPDPTVQRRGDVPFSAANASHEVKNHKALMRAHQLDKDLNPKVLDRPEISKHIGLDHGTSASGRFALPAGHEVKRVKKKMMVGDEEVEKEVWERTGRAGVADMDYSKSLRKKYKENAKFRNKALAEAREDRRFGVVKRKKLQRSVAQSTLLSQRPGPLTVKQVKDVNAYRDRIAKQSNLKIRDLHAGNTGSIGKDGGPASRVGLWDHGSVEIR